MYPQVLVETLFHGGIFSLKFHFFTDQDMIDAIVKNCTKTKGPTIKMNKTNFEVHGQRTNFHTITLILEDLREKREMWCQEYSCVLLSALECS